MKIERTTLPKKTVICQVIYTHIQTHIHAKNTHVHTKIKARIDTKIHIQNHAHTKRHIYTHKYKYIHIKTHTQKILRIFRLVTGIAAYFSLAPTEVIILILRSYLCMYRPSIAIYDTRSIIQFEISVKNDTVPWVAFCKVVLSETLVSSEFIRRYEAVFLIIFLLRHRGGSFQVWDLQSSGFN